jgi:hypothetical protein
MRDHLEPDREAMECIAADNVIGQAALLWKLIYRSVHAAREAHPEFIIVRHEDLSLDPVDGYRNLYSLLGLEFTPRVEKAILNASSSENPVELSRKKVHGYKLDSRANVNNWKKRMTPDEINRVREIAAEVAPLYYSDLEW